VEAPFNAPYLEYVVFIPICLVLQLVLLLNTIHKECSKKIYLKGISPVIRISFITLQLIGIYWSLIDLLRFVIDPHTDLMQSNHVLCSVVAYSPKIIVIIYYGIYLHHVFYRLDVTFKNSCLELSKTSKLVLSFVLYIPLISMPTLYLVFLSPKCVWTWHPRDFPQWSHMAFCDAPITHQFAGVVISIGIVWVCLGNLLFGTIFSIKLKKMLRAREGPEAIHTFKIKAVMVKNTILVSCASLFTLCNWIGWVVVAAPSGLGSTLLYLDVLLNVVLVSLMFKYNEKYYKLLCRCCIRKCLTEFDKTFNEKPAVMKQQLERYLGNVEVSKSTLTPSKVVCKPQIPKRTASTTITRRSAPQRLDSVDSVDSSSVNTPNSPSGKVNFAYNTDLN